METRSAVELTGLESVVEGRGLEGLALQRESGEAKDSVSTEL